MGAERNEVSHAFGAQHHCFKAYARMALWCRSKRFFGLMRAPAILSWFRLSAVLYGSFCRSQLRDLFKQRAQPRHEHDFYAPDIA